MKRLLLAFIIILSFCLLLVSCDSEETRGEQGPQGIQGEQGIQGPQGPKGEDGEDGRGVEKFEIIDGELIIYYTDGTSQNLGKIQEEKDDPEEEGTAGLEYHLLNDGTLAVGLGMAKFASEIVIPSKYDGKVVSTIMDEGFKGYDKLKSIEIPDSITAIRNNAFYGCTSLESIVIPNSVTAIGSDAFNACGSLVICCEAESKPSGWNSYWNDSNRPVVWGFKANGTTEDGLCWAQNSNNEIIITKYTGTSTSVEIPSSINSLPVTAIEKYAFYDCSALTSVTIPNGVTSIGSNAFRDCTSLESVVIPNNVTTIGACAFMDCASLTKVTIPNSVTAIGEGAFGRCTSLKSIVIPDSVTTIGPYAFDGCTSLTIYCEAQSKPSGWDLDWNSSSRSVVWGHTHSYTGGKCVCGKSQN